MYPEAAQRWALAVAWAVIVGLAAHSAFEFHSLFTRPNPFDHPEVGVPRLLEGPFDPTRGGIDRERLPWVLDPSAAWPAAQRQRALTDIRAVTLDRYPLWAGVTQGAELSSDGAVVLERREGLELVVSADGLLVRRRGP